MLTTKDSFNTGTERKKVNLKQIIKIFPEKYIVFQCQDDEPMGQIRIALIMNKNSNIVLPQLWFELMCTNKQNYKVSNSKGKLDKLATTMISIYIKNIDNLEKCLSDKFRIRVFDQRSPKQCIIQTKLKVLIQKHKAYQKIDDINNNVTQTASRATSIYTNPSIYTAPSGLSSTAATDIKSVIYYSRMLSGQNGKIIPLLQNQQNLSNFYQLLNQDDFKLQFDDSNQKLYNKQKELKTAENNFQKNKAKQKVCFVFLIIVFFLSLLVGFFAKRIVKSQIWKDISDSVRNQYFK